MSVKAFFEAIKKNEKLPTVKCPDGERRKIWGYNANTGDVFVAGWEGDVWLDCSDAEHMRVEFD